MMLGEYGQARRIVRITAPYMMTAMSRSALRWQNGQVTISR
jgi:hypothetical protein